MVTPPPRRGRAPLRGREVGERVDAARGGVGEALGSSLCYLLSAAIAAPVLQKLAPAKLAMLRERAAQEREHMLLFNFFLRLTPFLAPSSPHHSHNPHISHTSIT